MGKCPDEHFGNPGSFSLREAQSTEEHWDTDWQLGVIHIGEKKGTFGSSPKSKFLLCVRRLEPAQVHSGAPIKAHKGELQDVAICLTITNESGQLCMFLMCPGEPGRSLLSSLLYYSPNTSSQHLLFSGLCPWEQNKLNNFFLQHLMNINTFFIYCLAKMTKNKNALQRKRTRIHQKYLACVIIIINKHTLDKHAACTTRPQNPFLPVSFLKRCGRFFGCYSRIHVNFGTAQTWCTQYWHKEICKSGLSETDSQGLWIFPLNALCKNLI